MGVCVYVWPQKEKKRQCDGLKCIEYRSCIQMQLKSWFIWLAWTREGAQTNGCAQRHSRMIFQFWLVRSLVFFFFILFMSRDTYTQSRTHTCNITSICRSPYVRLFAHKLIHLNVRTHTHTHERNAAKIASPKQYLEKWQRATSSNKKKNAKQRWHPFYMHTVFSWQQPVFSQRKVFQKKMLCHSNDCFYLICFLFFFFSWIPCSLLLTLYGPNTFCLHIIKMEH